MSEWLTEQGIFLLRVIVAGVYADWRSVLRDRAA